MRPGNVTTRGPLAVLLATALACLAAGVAAHPASAQYFGRNKVQYDHLQFHVLNTPHFEIYYYPAKEEAIADVTRMAERWYERLARLFQHDFEAPKPLIFYADHPDFQQTNTLEGFISEGTGGVTESLKDRVIMPLAGSYAATDHVLGHELVHAFQFNLAKARRSQGGLSRFIQLPLWLVEGMAEYLSVGRQDSHTAMWLRDAILSEDFPTIAQMSRESRFFPYRFGQALWAYIGGTYGDGAVIDLFRRSLRMSFEQAIYEMLGITPETLSEEWASLVAQTYLPLMEGRQDPGEAGTLLLSPATGSGGLNVAPVLSPDGRFLVFISEKDLFAIDLFLADARTGQVIRKLSSSAFDTHLDALAWTETAGSFSPDGSHFAFVVFAGGANELVVVSTEDGKAERRVKLPGIGSLSNPAWSPDGSQLALSGTIGGISDLFLYELDSGDVRQLTRDKHADYHPAWSPDGRTIAFSSDRGPETDFERLTYSEFQLALLDVATGGVRVLEVFGNVRHSNPQFSPDGESLYFLSDQDGFSDVYRLTLASGSTERITHLKTGVSGITSHSPALSVAARSGELAFSVFTEFEFHIYTLAPNPEGAPATRVADETDQPGRRLPPTHPDRSSRVADYLGDPEMGLEPVDAFPVTGSTPYRGRLTLDQLGQPYLSAGTGQFGYYIQAAASAYFTDMLGNRHLGVAGQAAGKWQDIGAQLFYADLSRRWNWALGGGHTPWQMGYQTFQLGDDERVYLQSLRMRIFETRLGGQLSYPFSTTRRVEFGGGLVRYGFDLEEERHYLDPSWQFFTGERDKRKLETPCADLTEEERLFGVSPCKPDALNMVQASVAWVGDNSFFGFASPIRGGRFRVSLEATVGTENFLTAALDWRRYYSPTQNLTVAVRGMHVGRYGGVESVEVIQPMFLGYEGFIRGYAMESFLPDECRESRFDANDLDAFCPAFSRLIGHRLAVANVELRVPLLGFEQFGVFNFPYMPTEVLAFADAGLAWDWDNPPKLELSRSSSDRVPVFSGGVSARFNVGGFMIFEAYRAYPLQRPYRGAHWGFLISPGW